MDKRNYVGNKHIVTMANKEKEVKTKDYKKRPKHKKMEPYNRKKV